MNETLEIIGNVQMYSAVALFSTIIFAMIQGEGANVPDGMKVLGGGVIFVSIIILAVASIVRIFL